MNKKEKIVLVDWEDSVGDNACWLQRDKMKPVLPAQCKTAGFLLEETEKYVTIVQTIDDTQLMGRISIPKRSIIKRKNLN